MTQPKFASARSALQRIALVALAAGLTLNAAAQAAPAATPAPAAPAAAPTQTPPFNGIAHIAIRVQSIADSLAFYNKLGFQQAFANTGRGGSRLAVLRQDQRQAVHRALPGRPAQPGQAAERRAEHLQPSSISASRPPTSTPPTTFTSPRALRHAPWRQPARATCSSPSEARSSPPSRRTSSTPSTCPPRGTRWTSASTSAPTASPTR